ncbi:MAG TPA: DUF305 domain-containing protein [bacterium]|jgi:uncharacterized protein (DUF305 family)
MRGVWAVLLVVSLLATTALAAGPVAPPPDPTVAALSKLSGPAFDTAFMRALIPVDEEAVEIASAATLNADHTELLKWNQKLIERKTDQVRRMLAWLKEAGVAPGKRNVGVASAPVKKMRSLKDAALERAYLPMMAAHLESSMHLAALAAQKAFRPDLRAFAAGIVKIETQESVMLRGWLKKWYP